MVRRFLFAISFSLLLLLTMSVGVSGVMAAAPSVDDSPYGPKPTQAEIDAYENAIWHCETPSLECLVRNTTRFIAIEMTNEIIGPTNSISSEGMDDSVDPESVGPKSSSSVNSRSGGAIAGLYKAMGGMYEYQPASSMRYVADVMDNAGMAPPAYAQGLGFASLDPILSLWKSFRNVAYFFFIAILIVIGIMIMLRQKISAQASVSAQQALPSIIISLILVTFSYAIAGLLIDGMYLIMFLIAALFNTVARDSLGTEMISMSIVNLAGLMFKGGALDTLGTNQNAITQIIGGVLSQNNSNAVTGFLGFLGGLTISIIVAIAVLINTLKLFVELLKSYASIIMGVVFAPFYLMMGAIPGKNAFGPWIKNLVGNLAAFPTVLLFIIIFKIFTENLSNDNAGGFMPPYLIGNGQSGIAGYILGLAILLALPEIVKEVKKKMGAADGGLGWMVAGAAGNRAKEAWNKGFMGVKAKTLTGAGASAMTGGLGYLGGGIISKARGGTWNQGAVPGGLGGLATPTVVTQAPRVIRNLTSTVMTQGSQAAGKVLLSGGIERIKNIVPEAYADRISKFGESLGVAKTAASAPGSVSNIANAPKPTVSDPNSTY
ncbi:hypothetical protein KA012_00035 [Candidatus Woesebacteria bacterium]|nr:hypothetical protein [Candidatus Woesebacteria bacterium]